jgi:hypothetical protein
MRKFSVSRFLFSANVLTGVTELKYSELKTED